MSLYSALYAGVSGLSAQASAMASVADNITNINTVGYKTADTQFRTLVSDGRGGSSYSAGGVAAVTRSLVTKQGAPLPSASPTDISVAGAGFFVTRDGVGAGANVAYTRAGSFAPDKAGYLANSGGYYLQGWPLNAQGGYTNNGNLGALTPVRVTELTGTAAPTSKLNMRVNLDSTATPFTGTYAAGDMAKSTTPAQFSRSVDLTDAQGGSHAVTLAFLKTGANSWVGEIYAQPASDVTATNGLLASGKIAFNPDGSLDRAGSDPGMFATLTPAWTNGAGTAPVTLGLGTDGGLDGLSQFGGTSSVISYTVDGGRSGSVASTRISDAGVVSAVFDDGTSRAVYQLPIANFQNPNGLTRLPGNAYSISDESGGVAINAPGSLGAGKIAASSLEASTVDLAQEFTNMIRFQRAYSASSKIITTVDEMLQEVSNLKR
ncbi:flagellar hook protein FlgE [Sphingomonas glacialis]|uniref:Flagellar hook protein FlgE n=2 Tax=Sphingomonas glacialis TaxID=658225 RepID=A0ABQ3LQB8_9SPHN|nr:flagellar hook protein FlgE [Sphingomonas glacialis]GHH23254.1 flagellar hook protein FlgE [Sphingomonas glacialis]